MISHRQWKVFVAGLLASVFLGVFALIWLFQGLSQEIEMIAFIGIIPTYYFLLSDKKRYEAWKKRRQKTVSQKVLEHCIKKFYKTPSKVHEYLTGRNWYLGKAITGRPFFYDGMWSTHYTNEDREDFYYWSYPTFENGMYLVVDVGFRYYKNRTDDNGIIGRDISTEYKDHKPDIVSKLPTGEPKP